MSIVFEGEPIGTIVENNSRFFKYPFFLEKIEEKNNRIFLRWLHEWIQKQPFKLITISFSDDYLSLFEFCYDYWLKHGTHPLVQMYLFPEAPEYKDFLVDVFQQRRSGHTDFTALEKEYALNVHTAFTVIKHWKYLAPSVIKERSEADPESFYVNLLGIEYTKSKRPPTSMSSFARELQNIRVIRFTEQKKDYKGGPRYALLLAKGEKEKMELVFPVTRYGLGSGEGAYYKSKRITKQYCGTYFFWEPESHIYLLLGVNRYFINKLGAMLELDTTENRKTKKVLDNFVTTIIQYRLFEEQEEVYVTESHILDKKVEEQVIAFCLGKPAPLLLFDDLYHIKHEARNDYGRTYKKGEYVGDFFYALEDDVDQILCILAKSLRIDTLILAQMTGQKRVVTEVLDTREKYDSFSHLAWEIL